eukprot:TRINITY_DN10998_c0_g1_i3.p1 TRINITY_DN10998_c0_g1~~TRINITY_DN10998_c0_g1_i3.p1  ORF type:complete len:152 (+),score=50.82 TRINITY_DN10998_c0_g1_i3:61-456(+)
MCIRDSSFGVSNRIPCTLRCGINAEYMGFDSRHQRRVPTSIVSGSLKFPLAISDLYMIQQINQALSSKKDKDAHKGTLDHARSPSPKPSMSPKAAKSPDKNPFGDVVIETCLLYTSPSPRDGLLSRMPSSA